MTRPSDGVVLGKVVATERLPSSPHEFYFWTSLEAAIGIGAIVKVVDGPRTVFAVVTDGRAYSDLSDPFHDVIAAEDQPAGAAPPTARRELRLWTAAVLRQLPEEPLQPVAISQVLLATPADVETALRMETYLHAEPPSAVPIGLYASGGLRAPVYLDADFLLGPESAHVNISGVSGLATKTSAVEFLLKSLFAHLGPERGRVAAVCFNVKGADLCFLDQPAQLSDDERGIHETLGIDPAPFDGVQYYAPYKADGCNLNTLRSHEALADSVHPLVWGLRDVLDYHEVLLTREDLDAKAAAFIDFLADRVLEREFRDEWGQTHRVRTFADLERLFRAVFDGLETTARGGEIWRTHHIATIRKVRNRLLNISVRCKGLVTDDGISCDLPFGEFDDRGVYVIDVAGMDQLAQDLVFTRVVSRLREHLERQDLGVDRVVVFVDELNKYAPGDGPETYVKKMLLDISERGRYLGLVLFSAQQFRSQVHRRVVGNAGTMVFGRMDMDELATPGYQVFSPAVKSKLATLAKGELMVRHPHFTQPVFLRFPRPAVLTGRDGLATYPPAPDMRPAEAVWRQLRVLDRSVPLGAVEQLVQGRHESDVRRALVATRQKRPAEPLAYFKRALGARVVRDTISSVAETVAPVTMVDDPYE